MRTKTHPAHIWRTLMILTALVLAACGGNNTGGTTNTGGDAGTTAASGAGTTNTGGDAGTTAASGAATSGAATASATAADTPQGNAEISISLNADPPKLDPAVSTALVDRQVLNSLMDKLVDLDAEGNIVPMLATEWQVSDDNLTYTFMLREGVKFHDGTDFNADAVKFNLERGMTETSPRRNELSAVQSIEVVDPKTVKLTLKEAFAPFLSILTDRAGMMASPKAVQELGDDFMTKPVGTGPFKFQDRVKDTSITLVRNEDYWQEGLPKASKIVYKIFTDAPTALVNLRSGQLDFTDSLPAKEVPGLQQDANFKVVNEPGLGYQGFYLNTTKPPFDKKEVRKAVDMLINRDALVKVVFGETATPAHSPFTETSLAFGESNKYEQPNVEAAKQLLSQAGVSNPSFTFKTGTSPTNAQIAQLVQNFLQPAGFNMQIEKVEFGTLLDQLEQGNFEAGAVGWSGRPDPDQNIYDVFATGAPRNDSRYSNPRVDELLNQARRENDESKRKAAYDEVMQLVHEEVPYVFVYQPNNVFGMRANVTGFTYVPDGIIRTVQLNKQ